MCRTAAAVKIQLGCGADIFPEVELDYFSVAMLLVSLHPKKGKLLLCIDCTEWDFGAYQVNILMIVAGTALLGITRK